MHISLRFRELPVGASVRGEVGYFKRHKKTDTYESAFRRWLTFFSNILVCKTKYIAIEQDVRILLPLPQGSDLRLVYDYQQLVSQCWIIYHGPLGFKIGCSAFARSGEGAVGLCWVIVYLPHLVIKHPHLACLRALKCLFLYRLLWERALAFVFVIPSWPVLSFLVFKAYFIYVWERGGGRDTETVGGTAHILPYVKTGLDQGHSHRSTCRGGKWWNGATGSLFSVSVFLFFSPSI